MSDPRNRNNSTSEEKGWMPDFEKHIKTARKYFSDFVAFLQMGALIALGWNLLEAYLTMNLSEVLMMMGLNTFIILSFLYSRSQRIETSKSRN